ncbi:MAG: hypothetical protein ACI9I0_001404, partial [Rhodoferax sp.]
GTRLLRLSQRPRLQPNLLLRKQVFSWCFGIPLIFWNGD